MDALLSLAGTDLTSEMVGIPLSLLLLGKFAVCLFESRRLSVHFLQNEFHMRFCLFNRDAGITEMLQNVVRGRW